MNTQGVLETVIQPSKQELSRLKRVLAGLEGRYPFPALFDLSGCLIAAVRLHTYYGDVWGVLRNDNPHSGIVRRLQESQAQRGKLARARDASKGIYVGYVLVQATIVVSRHPVVVRVDDGFSRHVEVLDNGKGSIQGTWYRIIEELSSL